MVALSGRYDLTQTIGSFRGLFNGHYDDLVYFNTPLHYVPQMQEAKLLDQLRQVEIIFVIGKEDIFLENNRSLSKVLRDKNIPHTFTIWQGEAHRPREWREMVRWYL